MKRLQALFLALFVPWSLTGFTTPGVAPCARAGEIVPPSRQAVIVLRALAYDANLKRRAGDTINIAVMYKKGYSGSERMAGMMTKAFGALEATRVSGLPILVTRLPFTGVEALKKSINGGGIDVLYVCEGMEGELPAISAISRQMKVLTVGSREEHITKGLSLGVFVMDDKCAILLNLPASKREGVSFAADLLRLARVIR